MVRHERSATETAELKRLVANGQYRVDPVAVADAMIRRGDWILQRHQRPPLIVRLPRREGDRPS